MLARNIALNLVGLGAPLLVAIASIPPLITELGAARFGMLTLIWALVSYFGVFDLGLSRALTQQLSAAMGEGRPRDASRIAAVGLALITLFGALAGVGLWFAAIPAVGWLKEVPDAAEAVGAIHAMAWAVPLTVMASGLRGILESRGAFGVINLVRTPIGILTYLLPLLVIRMEGTDLVEVAWSLTALRAAACLWQGWYVRDAIVGMFTRSVYDRTIVGGLLGFGGWLTVSNLVSPLMGYLDRFIIGSMMSLSATAWYVTPKEMVTKLQVLPTAVSNVLFPLFARCWAQPGGKAQARQLERQGLAGLFIALFPITLVLAAFGEQILGWWVGDAFATRGAGPLIIFSFGVFLNGLAQVPYLAIQARGRADQTALLNFVEMPLFLGALYVLSARWGVMGAAAAWTLRIAIDFVALSWISRQAYGPTHARHLPLLPLGIGLTSSAAFGAAFITDPGLKYSLMAGFALLATAAVARSCAQDVRALLAKRAASAGRGVALYASRTQSTGP